MSLKFTYSPDPKYLAATDLLIGDMSDVNYEFLLFDKPIVLLANKWLVKNFPDIGIRTDLKGLEIAIHNSLTKPEIYSEQRALWLSKTIYTPSLKNSASNILDIITKKSKQSNPTIYLVFGGSQVRKSNLEALFDEGKKRNLNIEFISDSDTVETSDNVFIGAHFDDLIKGIGFKVHIGHGLKGRGTAQLEHSIIDYINNNHFPDIDVFITAGMEGRERTANLLLGPYPEKAIIGGYPKADSLMRLNNLKNKTDVCHEFGFSSEKPLITYAPAGQYGYEKPGGSLSYSVLKKLSRISNDNDYNILVKLKNRNHSALLFPLKRIKDFLLFLKYKKYILINGQPLNGIYKTYWHEERYQ
jgi:CDP-glycerol glycerophosphotransferase (TagB/SpsB family)